MIDYHVHTVYSRHGGGGLRETAVAAVAAGIREMGFSEHLPHPPGQVTDYENSAMRAEDMSAYLAEVEELRHAPPDGLVIRSGLEAEYFPGYEEWTADILSGLDLDYIIGSVHFLGRKSFDYGPERFKRIVDSYPGRLPGLWRDYLLRVRELVRSGLFQVVGHFDLLKKYLPPGEGAVPRECDDLVREIFSEAAARDMAIELNTSGWRSLCNASYPARSLLSLAKESGCRVTIGSDSHSPSDVGRDVARGLALLRETGFTHVTGFIRRSPAQIPL